MDKQAFVDQVTKNFPQELQHLHQWVVWRIEERGGKPTKVPYSVEGTRAASDNPNTWTSFNVACAAYLHGNFNGVGFMFSAYDPYAGVDFDKCITNGVIDAEKLSHIELLDSYTERSQSGTGIHVIVRGLLPPGGRKSNKHSMEMYDQLRFFVVTGDHVEGMAQGINDRQDHIEHLHAHIFPPKVQEKVTQSATASSGEIPQDDEDLLNRMFSSKNGAKIESLWNGSRSEYGNDESAADLALCNYLAFWTGNDAQRMDRMFRQSGLYRDKWTRAARTGETYGEGTIARAIEATTETYKPYVYTNGNGSHANGNGSHMNGNNVSPNTTPAPQAEEAEEYDDTPAALTDIDPIAYRAEDGGILDAWLEHYGNDWLFVVGPDKWHYWSGTHWMRDEKLLVQRQIESLMNEMNRQCTKIIIESPGQVRAISEKYAKADLDIPAAAIKEIERIKGRYEMAKNMHKATKRSSARIASVETMARFKRGQAVHDMDTSEAINLKNGAFNLRSLELFPHERSDMFTYCLDYEYDNTQDCPLFKRFISEVLVKEETTETDEALVSMFQELLGYSLTPETKREVMVWMFGEGGNGKSVAISVIEGLLGPMSMSIDFQTVGMPGNYDLADIPGKRVLFSTEAERNKFMAEGYIKRIVTGDTINTRPIYGSTIRFKSTAKIWWSMNDKPMIRDTTDSMWRRMKLIPFLRKFEEGKNADPELTNKLLAELSGILNWAIDGLVRLKLNNKFTYSLAAEDAKRQYREEANPVAQWLNTQTCRTAQPNMLAGALFINYMNWCKDQNEKPVSSTQFSKDLKRLKVESVRKNTGQMYYLAIIEPHERKNV